jgi:hypothetical protein
MLYAFFWVIPRRLSFIYRRFGTYCLFSLYRQVGTKILHTYLPMKMEQSVPKRGHINFRRRGFTQKKTYYVMNCYLIHKYLSLLCFQESIMRRIFFLRGDDILTKCMFVTQLSGDAGISVWRVVWVTTNCCFVVEIIGSDVRIIWGEEVKNRDECPSNIFLFNFFC